MITKLILSYFIHVFILCHGYGFHNMNANNQSRSVNNSEKNINDKTNIRLWDFITDPLQREYVVNLIESIDLYRYINTKHPTISPTNTPTIRPTTNPSYTKYNVTNMNQDQDLSFISHQCICNGCIWRGHCYTFINEHICYIFRGKYC